MTSATLGGLLFLVATLFLRHTFFRCFYLVVGRTPLLVFVGASVGRRLVFVSSLALVECSCSGHSIPVTG